jgi:hypothetical protein
MLNFINGRQPSFRVVFSNQGSATYREKVYKHFEIPQEIPKTFGTAREFLSSNWQNWSNLHALLTASLFAGLLKFPEEGFFRVGKTALR